MFPYVKKKVPENLSNQIGGVAWIEMTAFRQSALKPVSFSRRITVLNTIFIHKFICFSRRIHSIHTT